MPKALAASEPGRAASERGKGQRSRRTAATTSLIVRVRSALASLLPDDRTFRSHMASCLDNIRAKTEDPTPGRRPGYKAQRCMFLDALPESHPKRPSRLEVYEALDALLKAVWPQPLSSAEKMRRWRANDDNRDRERTEDRQRIRQRQRAESKREAEVPQPRVRQRDAAPSPPNAEAPSDGDDVEEVAPPLQSSAAAATSLAGGDVQISAASGAPKPPPS